MTVLYDVFICHASEDKESFVRPLADALRRCHLEVWYDEFSLVVGDSLRESIDNGLAKSRYGIVVLSPAFFNKKWPVRELNGLVAREMAGEDAVILPVWHNISLQQIIDHSPPMADRKAVDSKDGLDFVLSELVKKIRPDESPLLVARDELLFYGLNPPVISDEWWLNVVEASNRIPSSGFLVPEEANWGRWTFPLPNYQSNGEARGVRLAWTAMQMRWESEAEKRPITQITRPEVVLDFIGSQPGLREVCHKYPDYLAAYAPQLTIRGFGGEFESDFDSILKSSIKEQNQYRNQRSKTGTALTVNAMPPACSEEIALRHPSFGDYDSAHVACQFVQGEIGGPSPRFYDYFEYVVWFLSSDSEWLPDDIHKFLIDGMRKWDVWNQLTHLHRLNMDESFFESLWKAKDYNKFKITKKTTTSLLAFIDHSLKTLRIKDDPKIILKNFITAQFIENHFQIRQDRDSKKT